MKRDAPVLPMAFLGALPLLAAGAERDPVPGAAVEVTAPLPDEPLVTVLDPRQPCQSVPAQDGAEALRLIPGFAMVRKGGTGGEPVLRGMAGSRMGVLVDGEDLAGGCGGRMDPPTAYVLPEAWDRVQVVKGPQTVRYGPGNSAGTVLFQRTPPRWDRSGWTAGGSWLAGGFDRRDRLLEAQAGSPRCYGRAIGLDSRSGDYHGGDGRAVHSRYHRWSTHGALGWTPDERTRLECRATRGDGQAAYADRGMDGVGFLMNNLGLAFEASELSPRLGKLEVQVFRTGIDHVMDNGSLRPFAASPGSSGPMARNPRRVTRGARVAVTLSGETNEVILGADLKDSQHDVRRTPGLWSAPLETRPRIADARLSSAGLFGEWTRASTGGDRLVAGLRADAWRAEDLRLQPLQPLPGGASRDQLLLSGFARQEWALGPATVFAGLGSAQRPPDYWELIPPEGVASPSAFGIRPERTTQLDFGSTRRSGGLTTSFSGFYGVISDFILIQSAFPKPAPDGSTRPATVARNVMASTWGGEVALSAALADPLRLDASLACSWGRNHTDRLPLAQMPPPEVRLGLTWAAATWSAGSLVRLVAPQDRIAPGQGTIAGQDLGRSPGFAVVSVNAGWRPANAKALRFSAGIDNLLDRAYAEHLNRSASPISGYGPPPERVAEPGRTLWLKVGFQFP